MTEARKRKFNEMLRASRLRLCGVSLPFGIPLLEMYFVATSKVYRISTNGKCIYFNPDWLQKLGDDELDFALAHQLMHIHLGHIERPLFYKGDRFHLACDIVANANLEKLGWEDDELMHIGKIYKYTFYPEVHGAHLTSREALKNIPFDPATLSAGSRRRYLIDSEEWWDKKDDRGETGTVIVSPDSNIDDINDVFFLPSENSKRFDVTRECYERVDKRPADSYRELVRSSWEKTAADDLKALREMKKSLQNGGDTEQFVERMWDRVDATHLDWRKILRTDIQSDVKDYSFIPVDKRYDGFDFFFPDYSAVDDGEKSVLLFVDTSASVTGDMLGCVYGEISAILSQFDGMIKGQLVFFDTRVYPALTISGVTQLGNAVPCGGGSTDYSCVFEYTKKVDGISNIIIFTDGAADYPDISVSPDAPVLWLMTKPGVVAPWGKTIVIN